MITRAFAPVALFVSLTAPLGGQDLSGVWQYRSPNAGEVTIRLRQDSTGGVAGTLIRPGRVSTIRGVVDDGVLRGTAEHDGVMEHIEARLVGASLLWRGEGPEGDEYALQRLEGAAAFVDSAPADPFAGTWIGEGVRLVLEGRDGTYSGSLTVAGATWSVLGRANGSVLLCTVASQGETGRLTATLSGDALMLSGRAASTVLQRVHTDSSQVR